MGVNMQQSSMGKGGGALHAPVRFAYSAPNRLTSPEDGPHIVNELFSLGRSKPLISGFAIVPDFTPLL